MAHQRHKLVFQPLGFLQSADVLHHNSCSLSWRCFIRNLLVFLDEQRQPDGTDHDRLRGPIGPTNHFLQVANRLLLPENLHTGEALDGHGAPISLCNMDARGAEEVSGGYPLLPARAPGGFSSTVGTYHAALLAIHNEDSAGQFVQDRLQQAAAVFSFGIEQRFTLLAALHRQVTKHSDNSLDPLLGIMEWCRTDIEFPLDASIPDHQ